MRISDWSSDVCSSDLITPTPFLNVSAEVSTNSERGLLGLATAPDFASSGVFYVNLTNLNGDTEIRRYRTLAADRNRADPASADLILGFDPPFANHNGGWIDLGPSTEERRVGKEGV